RDDPDGNGDFTADVSGSPAGLRDAIATALPVDTAEGRGSIPFRTTAAVARGEVALVRTDPVIGALAAHVLNAARDMQADGPRPARRCGVIRSRSVTRRTTLLLIRYRFHLSLPSRTTARQLVAEDVRLLALQGPPAEAVWLNAEDAIRLLD